MNKFLKMYIMEKKETTNLLKPYSISELAILYHVKPRTIKNWLMPFSKKIGKKTGRLYTVKQVSIIFDKIGEPPFQIAA